MNTWSKITIGGVDYPIKDKDKFIVIKDTVTSYYDGNPIENISFSAELENGDIVLGSELQRGDWKIIKKDTCPTCGAVNKISQDVKK